MRTGVYGRTLISIRSCRRVFTKRFESVYQQGVVGGFAIYVDRVTGVSYPYYGRGDVAGLAPLLNAEGNPVVMP